MNDDPTLHERLDADGVDCLWLVYHDYSGRACTKIVPRESFATALARGIVFARANLSMRVDDQQPAEASFLADSGDFLAVADPLSYARVPYREKTARAHVFMRTDDGSSWDGCPRTRLLRMVAAYAERGLSVRVGFEPEFILFRPGEAGEYEPADTDGMFTLRGLDRHYELFQTVIGDLREMGMAVTQLGKEYGAAQYEGTTAPADPIGACDQYLTYKEVVRARSLEAGLIATFMPKPYAHLPGNSLHVHLSLWDEQGERELSCGTSDDEPLSDTGRHMLAGLLAHAAALSGVGCPVVNSYKRLQPGSWAPAHVCWGFGNRSALVRVPGAGVRRHLEYRAGDNAANAYVYLTSLLAAGLDGIERAVEPPASIDDVDVGHLSTDEAVARGLQFMPRTLPEALDTLETDEVLAQALGSVIFTEHLKVKRSELAAYELHVHPWERRMYLETL